MLKEGTLHFILTLMFILLGLLVPLIPGEYAHYAELLSPVLFGVILSGILLSFWEATLIGALIPLGVCFLYGEVPLLPDTVILILTYSVTGLFTGIIYSTLRTALGAVLSGLLAGRIAMGVSSVIFYYRAGDTYSFSQFSGEALLNLWPCIILCAVFIPVLTGIFRKQGVMQVLRHEGASR